MAGRTAGRIPPSTAVIKIAHVVIASVTHDSGWARGSHADLRVDSCAPDKSTSLTLTVRASE
jgi:hypothetical protein